MRKKAGKRKGKGKERQARRKRTTQKVAKKKWQSNGSQQPPMIARCAHSAAKFIQRTNGCQGTNGLQEQMVSKEQTVAKEQMVAKQKIEKKKIFNNFVKDDDNNI